MPVASGLGVMHLPGKLPAAKECAPCLRLEEVRV